ncbi:DUF883 family protein [Zavarzinella formosa]|uniref:DUF883 family protein n=1 Tax=Zavarzinella formosa TaxID=360055 RepID=UPI0002F0E5BD|nr:DUF883 family protein [Zavarzinella formosa]
MSDKSPELIELEMASTRQSLTEKVAALEEQVVGTLQSTTAAVNDTVNSLRSAVTETVDSVKGTVDTVTADVQSVMNTATDNVKDVVDVTKHVRDNPWLMVGGAAAAGLFAGLMLFRKSGTASATHHIPAPSYQPLPAPQPIASTPTMLPPGSRAPGLLDELFSRVSQEVRKVAETAISTLSESVKKSVNDNIPKMVEGAVTKISDSLPEMAGHGHNGHAKRIKEEHWE